MALRIKRLTLLSLTSLLFLAACSGAESTESSERAYRFALSPSALPANQALGLCASQSLGVNESYRIESLFPSQMDPTEKDLIIHLAPPLEAFPASAQIGTESLFLITHTNNPIGKLNLQQLRAIFSGESKDWAQLGFEAGPIQLWVPTQTDEARVYLEQEILGGAPISSNAKLSASPERMLNAVREDPQAIGVLPGAWLDNSVESSILTWPLPLLISSGAELSGSLQRITACLQSGAGHEILMENYDG